MSEVRKKSRCGFIVAKFVLDGEDYFLMRRDPKWRDVNFVGGHEQVQEGGNLRRAARRELLEEVPAMRTFGAFELLSLTDELKYGPIASRSAQCEVEYVLRFFLLEFNETPTTLLENLRSRSLNVLVSYSDLIVPQVRRVSGLVKVLDDALPHGLKGIPYSWPSDLGPLIRRLSVSQVNQFSLRLN
jgi:hypothetical protein